MIVAERTRRADPGALAQVLCLRCDQPFLLDQPTRYAPREAGWVHERCPAATEFALGPPLRDYAEVITWTRHGLPEAVPPTSPLAAPELQVARALIQAAEGGSGATVGEVVGTAWLLVAERLAGRLSAAERNGLPDEAAMLFVGGSVQDRLLGYWSLRRRGGLVWYPGIAGLDARQAEVIGLAMEGRKPEVIRGLMRPKADGDLVAIESVYTWLSEGRRLLRELFKMPEPEEV